MTPPAGRRRSRAATASAAKTRRRSTSACSARETPQPRFCWHCRKPLHARSDRARFAAKRSRCCLRSLYSDATGVLLRWRFRHRQDLDERERWWTGRTPTIHIGSHVIHYGTGVFEGARCYAHAARLGLLPPRRARRPSAGLREDLPDGIAARSATAGRTRSSIPSARTSTRRATSAPDVSRIRPARRQSVAVPGGRGHAAVGMGRLPRRRALEKGVDVCVSSWNRTAPNTFPAVAKATANYANSALIKMEACSTATPRASRWTSTAMSAKAAARTCSSCGATSSTRRPLLVDPRRHHARLDLTIARGLGYDVREDDLRARCSTWPMRPSSAARPWK